MPGVAARAPALREKRREATRTARLRLAGMATWGIREFVNVKTVVVAWSSLRRAAAQAAAFSTCTRWR